MLFVAMIIGTTTFSLQYGIVDAYKHLWPRKGLIGEMTKD